MPTAPSRTIAAAALAAALAVTGYLLFRSLTLAAGTAGDREVCSLVFGSGCDAALRARSSVVAGIPLAGWGVIHFAVLLGLLAAGRSKDETFAAAAASAAALVALAGAAVSVALVVLLLAGAAPMCPLCLVAHGLNLAALVPVLRWRARPLRETAADWRGALAHLRGAPAADPAAARWRCVGFACVGLSALCTYQWILIEWDRANARGGERDPSTVLAQYAESPFVEIPRDPGGPAFGPPAAPVLLVVFSDAYCPACRALWSAVPRLVAPYPDRVRVEFRHFPLDPPCNPLATSAVHPYACRAGLGLEAALRQGRFWTYHDALAPSVPGSADDPLDLAARTAGLDLARFRADMSDPNLRSRLERDVALGTRIGIAGTPCVYLAGRRVENPGVRTLEILLAEVAGTLR